MPDHPDLTDPGGQKLFKSREKTRAGEFHFRDSFRIVENKFWRKKTSIIHNDIVLMVKKEGRDYKCKVGR